MAHIHTQSGQHDFTASAMIVRTENDVQKVLLIRHKKYGRYIQPGGHVELHENLWQAVLHEVLEETGYEAQQLCIMQPKDSLRALNGIGMLHPIPAFVNTHPVPTNHNHTDSMYLFVSDQFPAQKPGDGESQDFVWVDQAELNELPESELFSDTRDMFNHAFDKYLATWDKLDIATFSVENPDVL